MSQQSEFKAERQLAALRERVSGIAATLPDVVWSVEIPSHEVLYVSPAVQAVFGKSAEEMSRGFGEWSSLIHPEDRDRVLASWEAATRGGRFEAVYRAVTPQGAVRWIETRGHSALGVDGRVVRIDGMARDITERRAQEQRLAQLSGRLEYIAHYDELTGLPNRALFHERLAQVLLEAQRERRSTAVAVANIRRFRQVNEIFGREAGDALLRELAQRVRASCPERENVARTAGDAFAFILPATGEPAEIAARVEACLQAALRQPFAIGGSEVRIAVTTGVAVCPPDGPDAETLFRNAEAAKKKARVSGDRMLFYQPEMNASVAETLLLESRLHRAIENEEFELHYQPKVAAATGRVTGLEALIRWRDAERGLVQPAKFIPLLEETGMILGVGAWAIRKALTESRNWRLAHDGPLRIAVNVSPLQLKQPDFVDTVRRAIEGLGAAAAQLDLEITESMVMDDVEGNVRKLRELRDMGIKIAVDDFGTGYSSLAYLTRLPVGALKIDRSFVATMMSDAQHMTLVSTIISLGRALDLEVIAEGVETEDQATLLRLLKCDQLQGYLYSKPLPAAEVAAALQKLTVFK